jgi:hypothetical protein
MEKVKILSESVKHVILKQQFIQVAFIVQKMVLLWFTMKKKDVLVQTAIWS